MAAINKFTTVIFISTALLGQEKQVFNPDSLKQLALAKATQFLLQIQQSSTLDRKTQRSLNVAIDEENLKNLKETLASDSLLHMASTQYCGSISLSPDHTKMLITKPGHSQKLTAVNAYTGKKCLKLAQARFDFIDCAGWSPCGTVIWARACTYNNQKSSHFVRVWKIKNCANPQTIHNANSIHFATDQKIILAGQNKLGLYEIEKGLSLCKEFPDYPLPVWPRKKEYSEFGYDLVIEKFRRENTVSKTPESISLGPICTANNLLIVTGRQQNYLGNIPVNCDKPWEYTCIPRGNAQFFIKNKENRKIIIEDIDEISVYNIDTNQIVHKIRFGEKPKHPSYQPIRIRIFNLNVHNNRLIIYDLGGGNTSGILDLQEGSIIHEKSNISMPIRQYTPDLSHLLELHSDESPCRLVLKALDGEAINSWIFYERFTNFTQSPAGRYIVLKSFHNKSSAGVIDTDTDTFVRLPETYQYYGADFVSEKLLITYNEEHTKTHMWHLPLKTLSFKAPLAHLPLNQIAACHVLINNILRNQKPCTSAQHIIKECSDEVLREITKFSKNHV